MMLTRQHPAIAALMTDCNIGDHAVWLGAFLATGHFRDGRITDTGLEFDLGGDGDIHVVETDRLVYLAHVLEKLACMADHSVTPVCWHGKSGVRYVIEDWRRKTRKIFSNAGTPYYAFFEPAMSDLDSVSQGDLARVIFYLAGVSALTQIKGDGILLAWDNTDGELVEETAEVVLGPGELKSFFLECLGAWGIPDKYRKNRDQVLLIIEGWTDRPVG